jgi:hypothetical protein
MAILAAKGFLWCSCEPRDSHCHCRHALNLEKALSITSQLSVEIGLVLDGGWLPIQEKASLSHSQFGENATQIGDGTPFLVCNRTASWWR